jgi:transposase
MPSSYSENVKSRMVQRMSGPNGMSARSLASEVGIHQTTLSQWARDSAKLAAMKRRHDSGKQVVEKNAATIRQRRPEDWSPIEKLQAVMEASQVSEAGLGQWLRSKGLHESHLRHCRRSHLPWTLRGARSPISERSPKGEVSTDLPGPRGRGTK